MVALGAELAKTIESLGKTLGEIAAAGQDLMEAFAAVKDVRFFRCFSRMVF
jgi:hypothetical protein